MALVGTKKRQRGQAINEITLYAQTLNPFEHSFSVCPEWSSDAGSLVTFTGEEDKFGQVYTQVWVGKGALRNECGYDPEKQERQIKIILEHFSPVKRDSYEGDELIFGSTEQTDRKEVTDKSRGSHRDQEC